MGAGIIIGGIILLIIGVGAYSYLGSLEEPGGTRSSRVSKHIGPSRTISFTGSKSKMSAGSTIYSCNTSWILLRNCACDNRIHYGNRWWNRNSP